MRILSTTAISTAALLLVLLCGISAPAKECSQGKGITSNNIRWLIGNDDTLWMVTERGGELALNLIEGTEAVGSPTIEGNWKSFSLECRTVGINDLFHDGMTTVASFDTAPNVLWMYDHAGGKATDVTFAWPADTVGRKFTVNDIAAASGRYWLAALDGGLVGWNTASDSQTVFFPGDTLSYYLPQMTSENFLPYDSTGNHQITGVESFEGDSVLLVTTPSRLWLFSCTDFSWDSSITTTVTGIKKPRFDYLFVNRLNPSQPVYCIISDADDGGESDGEQQLCKYNRPAGRWETVFDEAPKALTFCHDGYYYALFDVERPGTTLRNIVRLYRDTLGDSGTVLNATPVADDAKIHSRMTGMQDIDVPGVFNDILYAPHGESGGYLWIATSEGLFLSPEETPGNPASDTMPFILIKRAPPVSEGLEKTYARPGILTPSVNNCKFIYNIQANRADVTIKVYDYNMDLVKTVIEKQPRISGKQGGPLGRSTVESEDSWDGTNEQHRPVSPGMYYYKITTSSGERAFGKIVVAR